MADNDVIDITYDSPQVYRLVFSLFCFTITGATVVYAWHDVQDIRGLIPGIFFISGIAGLIREKIRVRFDKRTRQITYHYARVIIGTERAVYSRTDELSFSSIKEISSITRMHRTSREPLLGQNNTREYFGEVCLVDNADKKYFLYAVSTMGNSEAPMATQDRLDWIKRKIFGKALDIKAIIDKPIVEKDLKFWKGIL